MLVSLSMGAEIADFLGGSPINLSSECMKKLDLCYHKYRKPFSSLILPDVDVLVGGASLRFEHVIGLNVIDDIPRTQGKIDDIRLTLRGVPSYSKTPVAKEFAYGVITQILGAGWKRYIYRFDPRIAGSESEKFEACGSQACGKVTMTPPRFDPYYQMSDEQWQSDGFYNWYFYKDGYYLDFGAWSSRSEKDPVGQASYLFSVEVKSEKEFWREAFESKDKPRWVELLPAKLEHYQTRREATEEQAERAGIEIDRTYQDAPIFVLEK